MEHHDIVIECGRFTLDKCREEILSVANPRCTPPLGQYYNHLRTAYFFSVTCDRKLYFTCTFADQSSIFCAPINIGVTNTEILNEEETFWSPSTAIPSHTPPPQNTSHELRSAPPTPNNNKSGTSPPEAAIEATPETTPVKVYKNNSVHVTFRNIYYT